MSDNKRKVYRILRPGAISRLKITEESIPELKPDEVQVKVKSIGLNFADVFTILGLYKAAPKADFIPGLEFSGVISALGENVNDLKVGQRVMGVTKFGAYATVLTINQRYVMSFPEPWSFNEAAAFPVQVLTAFYALIPLGNLKPKQTVLIHSGAGGVGLMANRIAKKFEAYTIGVLGNENKIPLLKKEGFDDYIVRDNNFKTNLKKILGDRPLDLVLETNGGNYLKWSYEALQQQGRLVAYGSAQFTPPGDSPNYLRLLWTYLFRPKIDPHSMITENKSLLAFNLIWMYEKADLMWEMMEQIQKLDLPAPYVGHTYRFDQLPDAIRMFKSGKTMGKVVVEVSRES